VTGNWNSTSSSGIAGENASLSASLALPRCAYTNLRLTPSLADSALIVSDPANA
jgi:hypothetical protein